MLSIFSNSLSDGRNSVANGVPRNCCAVHCLRLPLIPLPGSRPISDNVKHFSNQRGVSLIELVVVSLILSLFLASAYSNIDVLNRRAHNASQLVSGYFRQVRATAVSHTLAYQITPASATTLSAGFAATCSAGSFTTDSRQNLPLPAGVQLTDTSWSLCFSSRGFAQSNVTVGIQDIDGNTESIEVFLGGGIRTN